MDLHLKKAKRGTTRFDYTVEIDCVTNTQFDAAIHTVEYPGTLMGFTWEFDAVQVGIEAEASVYWVLVIVRQGQVPNAIPLGFLGQRLYSPTQDILHTGTYHCQHTLVVDTADHANIYHERMRIDSQRRVYPGDKLYIISKAFAGVLPPFSNIKSKWIMTFYNKTY